MDRSKADVFTKLFAIGQSAWLIVQCIARAAQGLRRSNQSPISGRLLTARTAVTELELATMGLVGCALVMYLLWWDKPFDVQHSLFINCPLKDRDRVIRRLSEIFQERYASKFLSPDWEDFLRERRLRNWAYMNDIGLGKNQGRNVLIIELIPQGRTTWLVSTLSIMGMGMAFCALHLIAWNWAFPSNVENYLWRSAALSATVACIPVAILLPLLENGAKRWQHYIVIGFVYPLCGLYMLCRIILIVQIFICFRSMPEGVYKSVEWTDFLPKVS